MADQMPTREQMLADLQGKPSREQMLKDLNEPSLTDKALKYADDGFGTVNAAVNGAAKFATLGYAPQIAGVGGAATGALGDLASGNMPDYDSVLKDYTDSRDKAIKAEDDSWDKHPVAYGTGAVAGSLASPVNKVLSPFKGVGVGGKIVAAARNGALMGAVANPGDKKGVVDPLQLPERVENAGGGALVGGGIESLIQGAGPLAKKGISTLLGPSEDSINKYLQNRDTINKTPTIATMKDMIDAQVLEMKRAVESGQMSVDQAQAHLKDLNGQLAQVTRDSGQEFSQALPYLREGLDNAKIHLDGISQQISGVKQAAGAEYTQSLPALQESLENARGELGQEIQQAKTDVAARNSQRMAELEGVGHPREMADDVHQAVADLKQQVVQESSKARNILAASGETVKTEPLLQQLRQAREGFFIDGAEPVTPQAKAALQRLDELYQNVSKLPKEVKGTSAKKLVQQLDQEVEFSREAGGFGDDYSKVLKDLRRGVDAQLKQNPEYAEQMKAVAEKTGLLDNANQLFGTRQRAYSAMNGIGGESKVAQRDILAQLGRHTGNDFEPVVNDWMAAQEKIKNFQPEVFAGSHTLPAADKVSAGEKLASIAPYLRGAHVDQAVEESGLLAQRQAAEEALRQHELVGDIAPGLKGQYVEQMVNESGLPNKISSHEAEIERLKGILGEAEDKHAPYSKWGKDSTQNKLQSLVSKAPDKASIEAGRELQGLDALRTDGGDIPYPQMIENNRVLNDFGRDGTRGSRNAVMYRGIGGAIGAGLGALVPGMGHIPMAVGMGAGGVAGGYVDKNGGRIAKSLLDTYLDSNVPRYLRPPSDPARYTAPWVTLHKKDKGYDEN